MALVVPVSKFKAHALAMVDSVAATGREILITKRGKPVARLVPAEQPASLLGSVRILVSEEELLGPADSRWEAED